VSPVPSFCCFFWLRGVTGSFCFFWLRRVTIPSVSSGCAASSVPSVFLLAARRHQFLLFLLAT
jgi:hypothetical protein